MGEMASRGRRGRRERTCIVVYAWTVVVGMSVVVRKTTDRVVEIGNARRAVRRCGQGRATRTTGVGEYTRIASVDIEKGTNRAI